MRMRKPLCAGASAANWPGPEPAVCHLLVAIVVFLCGALSVVLFGGSFLVHRAESRAFYVMFHLHFWRCYSWKMRDVDVQGITFCSICWAGMFKDDFPLPSWKEHLQVWAFLSQHRVPQNGWCPNLAPRLAVLTCEPERPLVGLEVFVIEVSNSGGNPWKATFWHTF